MGQLCQLQFKSKLDHLNSHFSQQVKIIPKCDNLSVKQPGNSKNKNITKDTDDIEYTNDLIYNISDL